MPAATRFLTTCIPTDKEVDDTPSWKDAEGVEWDCLWVPDTGYCSQHETGTQWFPKLLLGRCSTMSIATHEKSSSITGRGIMVLL